MKTAAPTNRYSLATFSQKMFLGVLCAFMACCSLSAQTMAVGDTVSISYTSGTTTYNLSADGTSGITSLNTTATTDARTLYSLWIVEQGSSNTYVRFRNLANDYYLYAMYCR